MTHTLAELDQIVGGMTEQMNDKMDTDGRNGTSAVDYVVEWQLPTAENNYSWYRKYKSGWVEQGGTQVVTGGQYAVQTINLLIEMMDKNYHINCFAEFPGAGDTSVTFASNNSNKTTTSFGAIKHWASTNGYCRWEVKGISAQS